jgi:hypothetical protein
MSKKNNHVSISPSVQNCHLQALQYAHQKLLSLSENQLVLHKYLKPTGNGDYDVTVPVMDPSSAGIGSDSSLPHARRIMEYSIPEIRVTKQVFRPASFIASAYSQLVYARWLKTIIEPKLLLSRVH